MEVQTVNSLLRFIWQEKVYVVTIITLNSTDVVIHLIVFPEILNEDFSTDNIISYLMQRKRRVIP